MEFSEGQQLRSGRSNKYTLQERLAATRLSTVWKAEDVSSATVVIKVRTMTGHFGWTHCRVQVLG